MPPPVGGVTTIGELERPSDTTVVLAQVEAGGRRDASGPAPKVEPWERNDATSVGQEYPGALGEADPVLIGDENRGEGVASGMLTLAVESGGMGNRRK